MILRVCDYEKQIDQLVYLSVKALASADKLYNLTPEDPSTRAAFYDTVRGRS